METRLCICAISLLALSAASSSPQCGFACGTDEQCTAPGCRLCQYIGGGQSQCVESSEQVSAPKPSDNNNTSPPKPSGSLWLPAAPLETAVWGAASATVGGNTYAVGGKHRGGDATASTLRYDQPSDSWQPVANLSQPRAGLGVATLDGMLLAIGGTSGHAVVADVEAYEPTRNIWKRLQPLKVPRSYHGAAVIQGKLYVIGGCTDWSKDIWCHDATNSVEVYNPDSRSWHTGASMHTARYSFGVAAWEGHLLAFGGQTANGVVSAAVESFNPATNKWIVKADLPAPRAWFGFGVGAFPAGSGSLYAIGGCGNHLDCRPEGDAISSVVGYPDRDPRGLPLDRWFTMPIEFDLPQPRVGLAVGVNEGGMYAIGGLHDRFNTSNVLKTVEVLLIV